MKHLMLFEKFTSEHTTEFGEFLDKDAFEAYIRQEFGDFVVQPGGHGNDDYVVDGEVVAYWTQGAEGNEDFGVIMEGLSNLKSYDDFEFNKEVDELARRGETSEDQLEEQDILSNKEEELSNRLANGNLTFEETEQIESELDQIAVRLAELNKLQDDAMSSDEDDLGYEAEFGEDEDDVDPAGGYGLSSHV